MHSSSEVSSGSSIEGDRRVADLAEVVGRDVRGHPDGDARRAVDEQVRQLRREDRRLLLRPVVVRDEVDGLLVDVGQHLGRDRGQPRLGVAHRRGPVAVDRAEVALAIDQRVAHREVLGQPDEGVVQGDVAVRVVLAHDLADDRGALAVGARAAEAHLAHRVQDPAVDRLEAVADIGQRARHDHAHRVVEVAGPHLVLDADRADRADVVGHGLASPGGELRSAKRSRWAAGPGRPASPANLVAIAAARDVDGLPARRRMPSRRARIGGRRLRRQLREGVADHPGAGPVVRLHARARSRCSTKARTASGSRAASERSAQESAFWTSGSSSPMSCADEIEPMARDLRRPAQAMVDERQGGDRRADEPPLPAGRREHEALELRPAIRLEEDPAADRVGERVDGDPVAGLAGASPEELPGAFGVVGKEPLEQPEREPAWLELGLGEQPRGDLEEARRPAAPRRGPEAPLDGGGQRPADAVQAADSRGDALGAGEVLGIGELGEPGGEARRRMRRARRPARPVVGRGPPRPACDPRRASRPGPWSPTVVAAVAGSRVRVGLTVRPRRRPISACAGPVPWRCPRSRA